MRFVWIWKPLASAAFVAFAWKLGALETRYGQWIFLGLILSWIGDVLLIPESKKAFLGGLVSFLLAHVAYAGAFLGRGQEASWGSLAACVAILGAIVVARWLLPHVKRADPKMIGPVLVYMAAISVMVTLAAGAAARARDPMIFLGAAMFYVSDLSVARDKFVAPGLVNRLWGLPLYYAAQFVLAWTVHFS